MKPLICPQCGGKITDYAPLDNFANCGYCGTRFLIESKKSKSAEPVNQPSKPSIPNQNVILGFAVGAFLLFGLIFISVISTNRKEKPDLNYRDSVRTSSTPRYTAFPSPTPTPNPNLLEFGGEGTGNGLFQDADKIAVDKQGRIYVADETLRVQQFNEKGEFIKLWQIPSETDYYKRARSIRKIAVDDNDRLYVLLGGLVLVYENSASEFSKIINFAPNPIQDFAFRSDGGKIYLVNDGKGEYLVQINEAGKSVRRINGFHTNAADASMSPHSVGLAAIRFAVDGAGNIFSVYALGDVGSYQLTFNTEDFMIFRFTPEGKYVNKFVQTMNSVGIVVDNQSRIYVSNNNSVEIYSDTGKQLSAFFFSGDVDAFTLDNENNIYILSKDKVIKRKAFQQNAD